MEFDLTINSKKRYTTFIDRVSKSGIVWGLKSEDGWCVCESNQYEETLVMLFWSDEAYAKQCAVEEWAHYVPTAISLEEFLAHWIDGMDRDELLVGVNWNAKLIGLEVEPAELGTDLKQK